MMFYMDSKEFFERFIPSLSEKTILDTQYVIVSSRIKHHAEEETTVISAFNILYPNSNVMNSVSEADQMFEYEKQLKGAEGFIATLISLVFDKGLNIVFICARVEMKNIPYLEWLSDYVLERFDYKIHRFKDYQKNPNLGDCAKSPEYIRKKCTKVLQNVKKKQTEKDLSTDRGRDKLMKEFKGYSKKELKKILKREDLYGEGMSKQDMIDEYFENH